jgi:hypothetical protein
VNGPPALPARLAGSFKYFPNPVKQYLDITCSGVTLRKIEVFHPAGEKLQTVAGLNTGSYTWDTGALTSGIYILRISTDNGFVTRTVNLIK